MHYKQNNKERKIYLQGLRLFGNTLPRSVKSILKKNGYNYSEIINKWNSLVGKEVTSFSYPKSIKMNKGNTKGTLVLAVERGNEIIIEYSKNDIINKINSYFGYKLISKVKLETFNSKNQNEKNKNKRPETFKDLNKKIHGIKSKDLRNSLFQLIESMKHE